MNMVHKPTPKYGWQGQPPMQYVAIDPEMAADLMFEWSEPVQFKLEPTDDPRVLTMWLRTVT